MKGEENQNKMIIMDFTGVYGEAAFYRGEPHLWLDLKGVQGTNCYCGPEAEEELAGIIRRLGPEGIHFLDSGNYHYASKLWTDLVEEEFELLVFDHHTDMQEPMFGDILSCGGWVKRALETNPRLRRVWLAGPEEAAPDFGGRVVCISEADMENVDSWRERLGKRGLPLYISVDKDVFSREEAITNWDQGTAKLVTALNIIRLAAERRRIIGMDVCGENPQEAGRDQLEGGGLNLNDRANRALAEVYLKACTGGGGE